MTTSDRSKRAAQSTKPKASPAARAAKARTSAPKPRSVSNAGASTHDASRQIDQRIRELGDWRGATLARMRKLILAVDPGMTEEWKWMGTPVWSCQGIVCTGESYAKVVKLTFMHGAALADPARLFNASLEGNTRRAIDLREGESVDARAFQALVRAAVALNASKGSSSASKNR